MRIQNLSLHDRIGAGWEDKAIMPVPAAGVGGAGLLKRILENKPVPIDVLIVRPYMEYKTSSAVLTKGGYESIPCGLRAQWFTKRRRLTAKCA